MPSKHLCIQLRCLFLAVALSIGAAATPAAMPVGRILEQVPLHDGNNWAIVDVPSGREHLLPRTPVAVAGTGWELWSASRASAHTLVRATSAGAVDFFDSETLQFLGGFTLKALPNTETPRIVSSNVYLSPDGKYVAAYWIPKWRQRYPEVVVFDRHGNIVQDGSPLDYDGELYQNALTWLPVGDAYLYVAGDRLVMRQVGQERYVSVPFHLPPGAMQGGPTIAASPDGHRLALSLPVPLTTGLGTTNKYWLLYVVGINGSGMHQLTRPTAMVLDHGWEAYHLSPSWSVDGRTLFAVVGHSQAFGAPNYQNPCSYVLALPTDGGVQSVDGERDPKALTVQTGHGTLLACRHAQWILP